MVLHGGNNHGMSEFGGASEKVVFRSQYMLYRVSTVLYIWIFRRDVLYTTKIDAGWVQVQYLSNNAQPNDSNFYSIPGSHDESSVF